MFGQNILTRRQAEADVEEEANYTRKINGKVYHEVYIAMTPEEIAEQTQYYQERNCVVKLVPQRYGTIICVRSR
jgi:hypothetical protein